MEKNKKIIINNFFKNLCKFLKQEQYILNPQKDGRISSVHDEEILLKSIRNFIRNKKNINFVSAEKIRNWYDFGIKINKIFIPINIKITKGESYDNSNSKEGLFWTFTDIKGINNRSWDSYRKIFQNKLLNQKISTNRDYYFLVWIKNENDFFFNSFKQLKEVKSNRNNLPFQIKWKSNKQLSKRNQQKSYKYLFGVFNKSLLGLRDVSSVLDGFKEKDE